MSDYLTTKELAELLRLKERKIYDLAASGEIPCSRATGKLLFARKAIDTWLAQNSSGQLPSSDAIDDRPPIFLGSHDPLLDWSLRESRCGIATIFDGSLDGLARFAAGEGSASSLHIFDAQTSDWNRPEIAKRFKDQNVVLMEWAKRQRGLITAKGRDITRLCDLKSATVAMRQAEAGSQALLEHLLREENISLDHAGKAPPARTESDAVLLVAEEKADVAFGLPSLAQQYGLAFTPIITERFDILVDRKFWFEPAWQIFMDFCLTDDFRTKAQALSGYDISHFGLVHFNA